MRIDINNLGVDWDHSVVVADVELPLLRPDLVDDCTNISVRPGGLLRVPGRLLCAARRLLLGEQPVESLRSAIASVVTPEYRSRLGALDGADLMRIYDLYIELQACWVREHTDRAIQPLRDRQMQAASGSAASKASGLVSPNGQKMTMLRSDEPLPQWLKSLARKGEGVS